MGLLVQHHKACQALSYACQALAGMALQALLRFVFDLAVDAALEASVLVACVRGVRIL